MIRCGDAVTTNLLRLLSVVICRISQSQISIFPIEPTRPEVRVDFTISGLEYKYATILCVLHGPINWDQVSLDDPSAKHSAPGSQAMRTTFLVQADLGQIQDKIDVLANTHKDDLWRVNKQVSQ